MSAECRLRFLPAPPEGMPGPPGRFGPSSCYAAAVWLPILGPASFVAWQRLARQLLHHPGGVTTSLTQLAADLGLGSPTGEQSAVARTLRRLERFGIVRRVGDELVLLREELPVASHAQLSRLDASVRTRHDRLHDHRAAAS